MPATACLSLLSSLESGASDHNEIQAEADKLLEAVHKQLCSLLPADGVGQGASAKHQLLQYLGPLQDMLNNERRRKVFTSIPFGLLRVSALSGMDVHERVRCPGLQICPNRLFPAQLQDCIFADENVEADSETTGVCAAAAAGVAGPVCRCAKLWSPFPMCALPAVLAAFAYWMERYPHPFGIDLKQHTAVICSRIRFPAIPPSVLSMFYKHCSFIHIFDSDKELLIRAVSMLL